MTLKQEFLDMLSLLNPNITEDSYDEDYVIETDFFMEICKKTGEEITYNSACSDCEYCSENCKYKLYKKVDLYCGVDLKIVEGMFLRTGILSI